ncbi:hypothetical protein HYZ41_01120 [archaeon]|nr:hypothetical protein [archaeon]
MAAQTENYQVILQELVRRSNEEVRRLRSLEQRMDAIEDKVNILIQGTSERTKKTNTKFAETDVSLRTVENDIINIKMAIEKLNKQLVKFVQKRDLKEMEHMIDLISPVSEEKSEDIREVRVS